MLRCNDSAGRFRVTFTALHVEHPYHLLIPGHPDLFVPNPADGVPRLLEAQLMLTTAHPFEGELCIHELGWFDGVPGRAYPANYDFKIEKLSG